MTSKYRFVLRKEAAQIAFKAGQIKEYEPDDILISEDIWGVTGEYDYDEKSGYCRRSA